MLSEMTRVRIGELAEDDLLAAVATLEPHFYSDEWKDRQLSELQYGWDWWNDGSHSLPKLTLDAVMEAAKDFVMNLVSLSLSSHHHLLIFVISQIH